MQRAIGSVVHCLIIGLLMGLTGCTQESQAPSGSTPLPAPASAKLVLGQLDFLKNGINLVDAVGQGGPMRVALDRSVTPNQLYIADTENSRVLRYNNVVTLADGGPANIVIGQPDLNSSQCNQGGSVSATSLCYPRGVAVDSAGNLYVADTGNNRVLIYAVTAPISTGMRATAVLGQPNFSAGTNNAGGLGPSSSSLSAPQGVAVDSGGHLYVADSGNNRVLEYDTPLTNATANHFFGQPDMISDLCNQGGSVSATTLCSPQGVVVDSGGHLFVADSGNNRVLEYNTPLTNATANLVFGQGNMFTTSTDGLPANRCNNPAPEVGGLGANSLCFPAGVALDSSGNLYVADTNNNRVLEYNTPLTNATANLVFGQGNMFTTSTDGLPANRCNNPAPEVGGLGANSLCFPAGIALDSSGNLYVADTNNNRVLEYNAPLTTDTVADIVLGQLSFTINGINFVDASGLNTPKGLAADPNADPDRNPANGTGVLYVADTQNNRILGFSNLSAWTSGTATFATSTTLTDAGQSFTASLINFLLEITGGTGAGQARTITGNTATKLIVSSAWTTIPDSTSTYQITTVASIVLGQPDMNSNLCDQGLVDANNNPVSSATTLCGPRGVAVDSVGNLYVADAGNNRVLEYSAPITTKLAASNVFGQPNMVSDLCNQGGSVSATTLCNPRGVAVDGPGNLYVADTNNNRVLEYNTPLIITAVPGSGDTTADAVFGQVNFNNTICNDPSAVINGPSAKSLCFPQGVALDNATNLYVADTNNNRVLEYNTPLTATGVSGSGDTTADAVFGQHAFTFNACNALSGTSTGGNTITTINDMTQSFAANKFINFVVQITGGTGAGQARTITGNTATEFTISQPWTTIPDSTSTFEITEAVTDSTLCRPSGVALDSVGNLYVADTRNSRVLEYFAPLGVTSVVGSGDNTADGVLGQPDFASDECNNPTTPIGGLSNQSLCFAEGIALDLTGNRYVVDTLNQRVLQFGP